MIEVSKERVEKVKAGFAEHFGEDPQHVFSAPGRTELGGNHTDHQRGHVLAAAVNLDVLAAVRPNGTSTVNFCSEGYPTLKVNLDDLNPSPFEEGSSAALIRGMAFRMQGSTPDIDLSNAGFDAYSISDVPGGSGLSSSAAFEVLIGTIFNDLFCNNRFSAVDIAKFGKFAENVYFGKPCGLMDQIACSVGGIVAVDFADPDNPEVEKLHVNLNEEGYALCIIESHASHADLTDEYAAVANEMRSVAEMFGADALRDLPEAEFLKSIAKIRQNVGDRAVLRAIHFYADDRRAALEADALRAGDFDGFLKLVRESGISSALYLQNLHPAGNVTDQSLLFTQALAERLLEGRGAVRVHGGGFGGTAQAFVPLDMLEHFMVGIDTVLGDGSCHPLYIRPDGGIRVE